MNRRRRALHSLAACPYGKQVARYTLYAFCTILYLIIAPQLDLAFGKAQKFVVGVIGEESLSSYFNAKSQGNYIVTHIAFQDPQDWMIHLKRCVPRGTILVITLIFSAGIVTIAANALRKNTKDEELRADVSRIQLKSYLIQAGMAGIRTLEKNTSLAIHTVLQTYAEQRGTDLDGNLPQKYASPVSLRIGPDTVTVITSHQGDNAQIEIGRAHV